MATGTGAEGRKRAAVRAAAAPRFWIGVASRDHVRRGVAGGFCQLGHGKAAPIRRLSPGDWIVYYSPRESYPDGAPLQAFTAIGVVRAGEPYAVDMGEGFVPTRRDVRFLADAKEAPIRPLLEALALTRGQPSWGAAFRRGLVEVTGGDFGRIAAAMGAALPHVDQTSVCLSNAAMASAVASPAAARTPARRATSRLPHLLDAAARAFAERGFAAASVRDIVGPVGMLPGSLYCHFATKEALLAAVYREGVERIGAAVDAATAPLDDPWRRLEAACVAHLTSLLDQTDYSQVVIRVRPSDAPAAAAELVALRDAYEKRFARLVAALPLARRTDRSMLRLLLVGALNWSQTWYREGGGATPEQIARRFVGVLRSSVAAR